MPYTNSNFEKYLLRVFEQCGTASLAKQLHTKSITAIELGDVFIRGRFPGHSEIVIEVAQYKAGKKIFLLSQSYTPAEEIYILFNPENGKFTPCYQVNIKDKIVTPVYIFYTKRIKTLINKVERYRNSYSRYWQKIYDNKKLLLATINGKKS